jgi:HD-like signal output (HDOD) protein
MGADEQLRHLPAQRAAALHVMAVASDGWASSNDVAAALQVDPAMTAHVLRLANSAYYGMSGRVRTVGFAVTVIGFSAVRSMAATFAAGVVGARVPDGFWDRAAASAACCSLTAASVGAARLDGFSVGLLHELGDYLLFSQDEAAHAALHTEVAHWDCKRRSRHERELFGTDHGEALARSLENWHFPDDFVEAYATHCEANLASTPLARTLVAGQALSSLALMPDEERMWVGDFVQRLTPKLDLGFVDSSQAWGFSRRAREEAGILAACLPIAA